MCGSCVVINVHGNYYYMVEGNPHVHMSQSQMQLMCGKCSSHVAINVHSNYYYMVEGTLMCGN